MLVITIVYGCVLISLCTICNTYTGTDHFKTADILISTVNQFPCEAIGICIMFM